MSARSPVALLAHCYLTLDLELTLAYLQLIMTPALRQHVFVDADNVHFVDAIQRGPEQFNFLFRGPNPLTPDPPYSFNYKGLCDGLETAAMKARNVLQKPYRIIDINLMQWENADEVPMILTECKFFRDYSDLGEFHFWETNGTGLCAMDEALADPNVRNHLAISISSWLGDRLESRMEQLHNWLEFEPPTTVVYAHCEGGIDRTGELMGAYYLRWLNKSWAEMNALNFAIANRAFGCNNYRATLWYCIYLVEALQFKLDYRQAFKCYDPGDPPEGHYACGSPDPGQ